MRAASLVLFAFGLTALAVAAYAGNPTWRVALFMSALFFTLLALAACAAVIETLRPASARVGWAALGLVAQLAAVVISRAAPLGSLPERPLLDLRHAGVSVVGLGLSMGGIGLSLLALRARSPAVGVLTAAGLLAALLAAGPWLARLS